MLKRSFDIVFSFLGLLLLSPAAVVIMILIKLDSKGPLFYKGQRVGQRGRLFNMYKFRKMREDADTMGGGTSTPDDDQRLTKIGRVLLKYKLDEIPQLWNVLKGDMSFVGPRPQVKWAVDHYTEEEKKILNVRPGITDYASIKFSNEGELLRGSPDPDKEYMEKIHPEKMRLALDYVEHPSFLTDMKILFHTLRVLLNHRSG